MYAPPELQNIRDKEIAKTIIPHKVDVFCFGMTFAELLMYKNRRELTEGCPADRKEFNEFIIGLENTLAEIQEGAWIDFANECLNYDLLKRPNAKELIVKFESILVKENMQNFIRPKKSTEFLKCIKTAIKLQEWELTILYCNLLMQSIPSTELNSIETKIVCDFNVYRQLPSFRLPLDEKIIPPIYNLESYKISTDQYLNHILNCI